MPSVPNVRPGGKRKADQGFTDRWVVGTKTAVLVGQKPWDGPSACVLVTWCPADWLLCVEWTTLKGELEMGAYMKRKERRHASTVVRSAVDDEFRARYPELYDYLTATCYDDDPKQPRTTSTLLVFGQDGCFKACLRDRAESCCCWVAAPTFLELLGVLESELAGGTAVWRDDRLSGAAEAKRRPREKSS